MGVGRGCVATQSRRSRRWWVRVLPDHLRETSTRRPPKPEGFAAVGFAAAPAGDEAGAGVAGLHAVAEPVRAGRGARLVAQRLPQPFDMLGLGVGGRGVALVDGLGQVLREIPDAPVRVAAAGEHALDVELRPEPDDVRRVRRAGRRRGRRAPPPRWAAVRRCPGRCRRRCRCPRSGARASVVDDGVGVRPPHLVIRRRHDGAQDGAGDGASYGGVQVRGEAALGFDGGEVLHVEADRPAQVLPEPVDQLREMDRVPGRRPVVIGARVDRGAVGGVHPPVRAAGEGEEQRRPHQLAVRLPRRRGRRCAARRSAAAGPGRPGGGGWTGPAAARPPGRRAPRTRRARAVTLPDRVVDLGGVLPIPHELGAGGVQVGAGRRQLLLPTGRRRRVGDRLRREVPALPALRHPQQLRPLRARLTFAGHRRPARDVHDLRVPGSRCRSGASAPAGYTPRTPSPTTAARGGPAPGAPAPPAHPRRRPVGAASSGAAVAAVVSSTPLVRGTGTSWARATTGQDRKPLPHNRSRARHVSCCCALVSVVVR